MDISILDYDFLERPGNWEKGRSGLVWPAVHRVTGQQVVIKFAPKEDVANESTTKANLRNEARALTLVKSLYVPQLVEDQATRTSSSSASNPVVFLAIERVGDLRVIDEIPSRSGEPSVFSVRERIQILLQFFDVLATAHRVGVVNNDVDLKHLFWNRDEQRLFVIDWGNATFSHDPQQAAKDLSRCNGIIKALLTNCQAEEGEEITLPSHRIGNSLPFYPQEYTQLIHWSPRASAFLKAGNAPVSADTLYQATLRWFVQQEKAWLFALDQVAGAWIRGVSLPTTGIQDIHMPIAAVMKRAQEAVGAYKELAVQCEHFRNACTDRKWSWASEIVDRNSKFILRDGASLLSELLLALDNTSELPRIDMLSSVFEQLIVDEQVRLFYRRQRVAEPLYVGQALIGQLAKNILSDEKYTRPNVQDLPAHVERIGLSCKEHFSLSQHFVLLTESYVAGLKEHLLKRESATGYGTIAATYGKVREDLLALIAAAKDFTERTGQAVPSFTEIVESAIGNVDAIILLLADILNIETHRASSSLERGKSREYFDLIKQVGYMQEAWLLDPSFTWLYDRWHAAVADLAVLHSSFAARAAGYSCYQKLESDLDALTKDVSDLFTSEHERYTSIERLLVTRQKFLPPFWEEKAQLREYLYQIDLCARAKVSVELGATSSSYLEDAESFSTKLRDIRRAAERSTIGLASVRQDMDSVHVRVQPVTGGGENALTGSSQHTKVIDAAQSYVETVPVDSETTIEHPQAEADLRSKRRLRRFSLLILAILVGLAVTIVSIKAFIVNDVLPITTGNSTEIPVTGQIGSGDITEELPVIMPISLTTTLTPTMTWTPTVTPTAVTTLTPSPEPVLQATAESPPVDSLFFLTQQPLRRYPSGGFGLHDFDESALVDPNPERRTDRGFLYDERSYWFRAYREGELGSGIAPETYADFYLVRNRTEEQSGISVQGRLPEDMREGASFALFLKDAQGRRIDAEFRKEPDDTFVFLVKDQDQEIQRRVVRLDSLGQVTRFFVYLGVHNGEASVYLVTWPGSESQLPQPELVASVKDVSELTGLGIFSPGGQVDVRIDELKIHGSLVQLDN